MKHRPILALTLSALCLTFSISAVWLWRTLSTPKFEASARLALKDDPLADADRDLSAPIDESQVLSPEVLSAAELLIADRHVSLSLASPFDSVTDYVLERVHVGRGEQGGPEEILITCSTVNADESVQLLSAVVDAYLEAATSVQTVRADSALDESAMADSRTECDQLAQAIEQQQQRIAAMTAQLEATRTTAAGSAGNDPVTLEAELAQARRASSDAAARLAAAHQDLEKRLPGELIATRIADIPTRTRVLEQLNQAKIRNELDEQEVLFQKWSTIYGRNHPRMAEVRRRIESLQQQVEQFSGSDQQGEQQAEQNGQQDGRPADALPATASSIVLAAMESESAGYKSGERELEARLAALKQGSQQQQTLESRLNESRQELEFLNAEHSRLWKQIDGARRNQSGGPATVIEAPALSANATVPQAGLSMAAACVSGLGLLLLIVWQLRWRARGAAVTTARAARTEAAIRRERFRSHEEEQLMRLKLQSAR